MSEGSEGPSKPPLADAGKQELAKSVPGFHSTSTFINKNAGGKKFAPNASRRRPAAAATAAAAAAPTTPNAPAGDPQPSTTPATTQDATPQEAIPSGQDSNSTTARHTAPEPAPAPTNVQVPCQQLHSDIETPQLSPSEPGSPARANGNLQPEQSRKQQRIEQTTESQDAQQDSETAAIGPASAAQDGPVAQECTESSIPAPDGPTAEQSIETAVQDTELPPDSNAEAGAEAVGCADKVLATEAQTPEQAQPRRTRRVRPWATVNQPRDEEEDVTFPSEEAPLPQNARGKRKAPTVVEPVNEEAEGEWDVEAASRPTSKKRGRAKSKATINPEYDNIEDEATGPSTKKARKTRKDKGMRKKTSDVLERGGQDGENVDATASAENMRPKRRRTAKRKRTEMLVEAGEQGGEGEENGEGEDQNLPRRRKRYQREPTPSDAENERIDTAATFMDNLASRNIRTGKLSEREKKMREINWAEVKQRRREQEALGVPSRRNHTEVDEALDVIGETLAASEDRLENRPQLEEVDGQIMLVQGSNVIDREAQADCEIAQMEQVEEDDLTIQVTSRSFLKDNKRFPEDFVLPGQGKRWTQEGTKRFYDALQMFGTDFNMISTLFPGTTRRSIKTKFTREERDNPAGIKAVLNGQRNSDWNDYLRKTSTSDDAFADPRAIERELAEEEARFQVKLEAAKLAAEEAARQKKIAGVEEPEEENQGGAAKENGKKKGRKKKEKQPTKAPTFEPGED